MRLDFQADFDVLMKRCYGNGDARRLPAAAFRDLVANYYGKPARSAAGNGAQSLAAVLSVNSDDGAVLPQRLPRREGNEYVVGSAPPSFAQSDEYLLAAQDLSQPKAVQPAPASALPEAPVQSGENQLDVLAPLAALQLVGPLADPGSPGVDAKAEALSPAVGPGNADHAEPPANAAVSKAKATDDDFIADMQSILSGQKVFDPKTRKTVDKDKIGQAPPGASENVGGRPMPDAADSQAIFDRIAQSMQYANAYDLGTVELESRFADFDRISDLKQKADTRDQSKGRQLSGQDRPSVPKADSTDFIEDLDAIRRQHAAGDAQPVAPMARATDPRIEALGLIGAARNGAYALWHKYPAVRFLGGRRTKAEQAAAMAVNATVDRKWIERTYPAGDARDACQKWLDDNPAKTGVNEIAQGLSDVLARFPDGQVAALTGSVAGLAFDLEACTAGEDEVRNAVGNLEGFDRLVENEGGPNRWHIEFK